MTDASHEPHPDDLLASAFVDGDLSPEDRTRVEADPALSARVTAFAAQRQSAREATGEPLDEAREAAITAAFSEFDALRSASRVEASRSATVLRWKPRTTQRVLAIAAAVVALGVVGVTVLGSQSDDLETSGAAVVDAKVAANSESATATASADAAGTAETAAPMPTIGAIDSPATAAITIDDPSELFAIADQYGTLDEMGYTADSVAATQTKVEIVPACVHEGEHYLTDVIYQGTLGIALITDDGTARILDEHCAVLAEATP